MRGCVYCGYPLDGGVKHTCAKHADLPSVDPGWEDFLEAIAPPVRGLNVCVHCDERVRGALVEPGQLVECLSCWWLVRFDRESLLEMSAAIDFLATAQPAPVGR